MDTALTRRGLLTMGALAIGASALGADSPDSAEISRAAASIHQQPAFTASRARVYRALLDARQFDRVVELSGVQQQMHLPAKSSQINPHPGGAFALFGGFITGRQVALVPNALIVQAWRADDWPKGVYSIARFELIDHDAGCRILFDHTGFPPAEAESLASGWHEHYWEPLQKLLS
jgi:activator of HSP90 ATPase